MQSFSNGSGVNWFNLFVFVPSPDPVDTITCGGDSFVMCIVLPGQFGYFATVAFEGGPGITNGQVFFADLGASGWMANAQFLAIANYTPEPGTLMLMMGGVLTLVARRRLRERCVSYLTAEGFVRAAAAWCATKMKPRRVARFCRA